MKTGLVCLLLALPLAGQPISVGGKVGIPMDPAGTGPGDTIRPRWVVGPTIEARVTRHFSIGGEALYRRLGYEYSRSAGSVGFFEDRTTHHWEFPIYGKYRLGKHFFVTGGAAAERAQVTGTVGCTGDRSVCGESAGRFNLDSTSWGWGYLMGGGMEFRRGPVTLAPEFRYARWMRGYFSGAGPDQPAVYLGIRF